MLGDFLLAYASVLVLMYSVTPECLGVFETPLFATTKLYFPGGGVPRDEPAFAYIKSFDLMTPQALLRSEEQG